MNADYLVLREQTSKDKVQKVLAKTSLKRYNSFCLNKNCLVTIAKRSHPFPFRTRKLSSSAPMVVGGCPPVRVGRCQANSGGLAQLGEHLPYKQGVGGSIPSSSTIILICRLSSIGRATDL